MESLNEEQEFILRRVELEAQELDREELIEALLASWEARFQMKATFMDFARAAGLSFRLDEARSLASRIRFLDITNNCGNKSGRVWRQPKGS